MRGLTNRLRILQHALLLTENPKHLKGIDAIVKNESNSAKLKDVLDKAILKETAKKVVFVTKNGRFEYSLKEVLDRNPTITYENGEFKVPELGIEGLERN